MTESQILFFLKIWYIRILRSLNNYIYNRNIDTICILVQNNKSYWKKASLHISFHLGLPNEVRYLTSQDAESFRSSLRSGFYYSYVGKLMFVGNEAVGKTAITRCILGKKPKKKRRSTEGIDIHIHRAALDFESMKIIPRGIYYYR